jgi:lysine/ornithine N-monooxygenase
MNPIDPILVLANTYREKTGVSLAKLGEMACRNHKIFKKMAAGKDCNASSLKSAAEWFGANWPADLEWPEGVCRCIVRPSGDPT